MLWRKRDDEIEDNYEDDTPDKSIVDKLEDMEDMMDTLMSSMKKVLEATETIKKQYEEMLKKEDDYRKKIVWLKAQLDTQNKFMQDLVMQLITKQTVAPVPEPARRAGESVQEYIKRKNANGSHSPRLP